MFDKRIVNCRIIFLNTEHRSTNADQSGDGQDDEVGDIEQLFITKTLSVTWWLGPEISGCGYIK